MSLKKSDFFFHLIQNELSLEIQWFFALITHETRITPRYPLRLSEYERGKKAKSIVFLKKKKKNWPAHNRPSTRKKISYPSMGESKPLFNGTMKDILLWRIASHSTSKCCGAAERGQQGWCRSGTLTLQTSQTEVLFTAHQFSSSLLTCGQESGAVSQCVSMGNVISVLRLQRTLYRLITKQGAFWEWGMCKPCYLVCICQREVCYYYTPENKPVT